MGGARKQVDKEEEDRIAWEEETMQRQTLTKEQKKKEKAKKRSLGLEGMERVENIGEFTSLFNTDPADEGDNPLSQLLKKKSMKRTSVAMGGQQRKKSRR